MELKTHLLTLTKEARDQLARECGTSLGHLQNVAYRYRPCAPEVAVAIWRATGGKVTREELRPYDYWLIWPDLPAPANIAQAATDFVAEA